jgi:Raf kinase inhibitor-like YbhB/YbcL family protein
MARPRLGLLCLLVGGVLLLAACGRSREGLESGQEQGGEKGGAVADFVLTSSAFQDGERIPDRYTCKGEDLSPPLSWRGAPEGTKSFALIVEDPDAPGGTFIHWVIYNLPAALTELSEGVPVSKRLEDGSLQGINDFRTIGYRGPCPPPGRPHRYFFILRALDRELALPAGATKAQLEKEMRGHVLGEAKLMGTYSR